MRKDMKDVIIDTGRHGGGGKAALSRRARLKRMDDEDVPTRISMSRRRQFGWDGKELGDRTNPLESYLEKNCGRQWNDVYSEICAVNDSRTIRGYHLRTHVWNSVVPNNYDVGHRRRYGPFFVAPDGTLQMEAPYQRRKRSRWGDRPPTYTVDADHFYMRIKGFWYYFETTHRWVPNSYEELVQEAGEVKIVRIQLKDRHISKTTKHQVNGEIQKALDAWAYSGDAQ
jgi:hypothetical protein